MVSVRNVCSTFVFWVISLPLFAQPGSNVPQNQTQLLFNNQYILKLSKHASIENVTTFLSQMTNYTLEVIDPS